MSKPPAPLFLNRHTGAAFTDTSVSVFSAVHDLLVPHCGPYASHVILPTAMPGNQIIDQYTKDGINIVKALKTDTPMAQHVMRLVGYVGERVDNACHDGTTTSMMLFCNLAVRLLKTIPQEDLAKAARWRHFLIPALKSVLDECDDVITASTITVEDVMTKFSTTRDEAIWAIAFHQAVIASKGDRDLAKGIADVLASIPVDLHGQYLLHHSGVETEQRFTIKTHAHDVELPGNLVNTEDYNHALRSEFRAEDAYLLVTPNELIAGNIEAEYLYQFFTSDRIEELDKPLILLTPSLNDARLYDVIRKHNATHPRAKIIGMTMAVQTQAKAYADAICAIAGVKPLQQVMTEELGQALIDHVGIEKRGTRIYLKNLYQKTGARLHPSYTDPTRDPFYTATLSEFRVFIENATKRHDPTHASELMLSNIINLYRFMASQQLIDLSIGGASHEHMANRSVVKDAYGAAVSAVQHGVVLGGHQRLLARAHSQLVCFESPFLKTKSPHTSVQAAIWRAWTEALLDTLTTIYYVTSPFDKNDTLDDRVDEFTDDLHSLSSEDLRWHFLESIESCMTPFGMGDEFSILGRLLQEVDGFLTGTNTGSVLMQPVSGYQEFFKRLRELLPKVVSATALVDPFYQPNRGEG